MSVLYAGFRDIEKIMKELGFGVGYNINQYCYNTTITLMSSGGSEFIWRTSLEY